MCDNQKDKKGQGIHNKGLHELFIPVLYHTHSKNKHCNSAGKDRS